MKSCLFVLCLVLLYFCFIVGGLSFGIVHSDDEWFVVDVQKKLIPLLGNVSLVDAWHSTPTAQQLASFNAILVYSVAPFYNYTILGDLIADYSDSERGVVVAICSLANNFDNNLLGGRFLGTGNNTYYVMQPGGLTFYPQLSLVPIDTTHPILKGVQKFDGGSGSWRGDGTWVADAHPVGVWSDPGRTPLIGTRVITGRRVDLNFYPPSSDAGTGNWESSTDGAIILANALNWAAGSL